MAFKDWTQEIMALQEKLKGFCPEPVSETMWLKTAEPAYMQTGEKITVALAERLVVGINDSEFDSLRQLRSYYTAHKKEFGYMLDRLKVKTRMLLEKKDLLIEAMSQEIIPDAVLARMRGENPDGDNEALLKRMTEKLGRELQVILRGFPDITQDFDFYLPFTEKAPINVEYSGGGLLGVHIEGTYVSEKYDFEVGGISVEKQVFFIANFELIKARVIEYLTAMEDLQVFFLNKSRKRHG